MNNIHPTALISESAVIAENVKIGAFCIVEEDVTIGSGCELMSHSIVKRYTTMGKNNVIHHNAVIGGLPQDVSFDKSLTSYTLIGDNNTFREYFTVHRSKHENGKTLIGNNNYFMANSHVGHDCNIKNDNILVNSAACGGHVVLEGNCVISGLCAIHQFCSIGRFVMMGGGSVTSLDIPPFMIVDGRNGTIRGINLVGLKRAGFNTQTIRTLKNVYKSFYASGSRASNALKEIEEEYGDVEEVKEFIAFVKSSKRGINYGRAEERRA